MFKILILLTAVTFNAFIAAPLLALNDPTKPMGFGEKAAERVNFTLNSILFSADRQVAIINGKAVLEGEQISGAKVVSISRSAVVLNQRGRVITLKATRPLIRQEK